MYYTYTTDTLYLYTLQRITMLSLIVQQRVAIC